MSTLIKTRIIDSLDTNRMEETYDRWDELNRIRYVDDQLKSFDWSCALYDGDDQISLEEAQRRKHEWILDSLAVKSGDLVCDVGCGWGPLLNALRQRHARGIGLTLSPAQLKYCKGSG